MSRSKENRKKSWGKRGAALCLTGCITLGLLPPVPVWAAGQSHTQQAHECKSGAAIHVGSYSELQTAVSGGASELDLVLEAGGDWTVTAAISIPGGKTIHLTAAEGERITLTRAGSCLNSAFFTVEKGGRLILGGGQVEYTGKSLKEAAEAGSYTVGADETAGTLVIDGGAVWGNARSWTPGVDFSAPNGLSAILYDENGEQKYYTNSGLVAYAPLISSLGTLDIWDGVLLQNNVNTGNQTSGMCGSAVQSNAGSTLNMFGGEISKCAVASNNNDTGRGAVFVGNFNTANWDKKVDPTDTHFNLYGGKITRNAASGGGNQDGGGVSVEQGYMDLYGGEVSYNHAGVLYSGTSGDGGGIMVRNYAQFNMWGGSVDHNFAGGYGGGIVAWNGTVNIHGGEITRNQASYGGGLAIASSNNQPNSEQVISSTATMDGGVIAYNEAIQTACPVTLRSTAGVGGGICVGSGTRTQGSTLKLSGGEIRQNIAANGGGIGVYAGGGKAEGQLSNTSVTMSGDFRLTSNFADQNGNGMYITNRDSSSSNPGNQHYLVKLSGGARVDTNNPVYFDNLCKDQIPVLVEQSLTTEGTAAIFEFSDEFWQGSGRDYDGAFDGRRMVSFSEDVQENKIALESTAWYLEKTGDHLTLKELAQSQRYTIRNGTPVVVDGIVYYRVYASLKDAFEEAANGDSFYIFYNTTIDTPAVLDGKRVTLMAESTSSAGRDAGLSGSGPNKTCWLEESGYGYTVMRGNFLKYVGSGGAYDIVDGTAQRVGNGKYSLDISTDGDISYNVRNDYTITLSSRLYLGEQAKGNGAGEAAIIVGADAALEIGQTAVAGMGAGALTFDGNVSSPEEGPFFQTAGSLSFHSGITVKNHANYSLAHPGAVEVEKGGTMKMDEGVTLTGNVSAVAGAVYVAQGGRFTMDGGTIAGNNGAMPRHGFSTAWGTRLSTYDTAYWGQGKYYSGAGAVYNLGSFAMNGGVVSGNRGEYGALANLGGGTMELVRGTVTGNHAQTGPGTGEYSLAITSYTEKANPEIPTEDQYAQNAGSGGGLYQGGDRVTVGSGMSISGNTALNGGGIAVGKGRDLIRDISSYTTVANGQETTVTGVISATVPVYAPEKGETGAAVVLMVQSGATLTDNRAERLGGGIFCIGSDDSVTVDARVALQRNSAQAGGGVAAFGGGQVTVSNEVTENEAVYGGGIYAGGGSTVTAQGGITSNQAQYGGGAYLDSGDQFPEGPGPVEGVSGRLVLAGALVNNNRLEGGGFGVGVYSRGDLELAAPGGNQPTLSYNDRVYLEEDRVVTLSSTYDITKSGQNGNNKLTLDSARTENGTRILRASSETQAAATLNSGFLTHYTHPMAQSQDDKRDLEINAVPVIYYDRRSPGDGLGSHSVQVPYASGDTVIFQNFSVGEEAGFEAPSGMSFQRWVTIDQDGHYLDSEGQVVDSIDRAHTYYAGNSIAGIREPVYLEAVYGTVSYSALLQVLDEEGDVVQDSSMGEITLRGATYNSSTGEYTFAMATPMTICAVDRKSVV